MRNALTHRKFFAYGLLCILIATAPILPNNAHAKDDSYGNNNIAQVLSVSHETIASPEETQLCSQTIVSDRQLAQREVAKTPWLIKYWQPIVGGIVGGIIGKQMGNHYGSTNNKWKTPTLIGGIALGALLGPGFGLGAYGLGALSEHYWPTKLPLEIVLALVGGALGDAAWKILFPASPPKNLLNPPKPGEYMADQQFFLETTCFTTTAYKNSESAYRVNYVYQGQNRSALVNYEPQETIEVDSLGNPRNESPTTESTVK